MGTWTGDNEVEYLIDGVATYNQVLALMNWVAPAHGQGYVHISMWECNPNTDLDGAGTLFWQKIKALADGGTEIRILLWKPGMLQNFWGVDFVAGAKAANEACKHVVETNNPPPVAVVTLAEHPDVEGAYHEKTMIFCNGDEVRCIVGGLNIANVCRDASPHASRPGFPTHYAYPNWHDVAVQIRGPATNDIEDDFIQRWNLNPPSPAVPVHRRDMSSFKPGNELVDAAQSLRDPLTRQILINLELDIRDAEFVYLENYSIHDPGVVRDVVRWIRKQRAAMKPHDVILVVPFPTSDKFPNDWLHYWTYCRIGFEQCDLFQYDDPSTTPPTRRDVVRATSLRWRFHTRGSWHWDSTVEWSSGKTSIRNLRGFYRLQSSTTPGGPSLATEITPLYTPYYLTAKGPTQIYIHSKVLIASDKSAAIGSANFNPRSLRGDRHFFGMNDPLDGELTAFIQGDTVAGFRQALWGEWFATVPTPAGWAAAADANRRAATTGTATPGRIYMLPVRNADFVALYRGSARKLLVDKPNAWGDFMEY